MSSEGVIPPVDEKDIRIKNSIFDSDPDNIEKIARLFSRIWKETGVESATIRHVVQFGPGVGIDTAALAVLFSQADFELIDYHDLFHPSLKANPRIHFVQGLFIEVLERGLIQQVPDLTVLRFISRHHGFNEDNISLLQKLVGERYLFTQGDNGGLERQKWFRDAFKFLKVLETDSYFDNATLWAAREAKEV